MKTELIELLFAMPQNNFQCSKKLLSAVLYYVTHFMETCGKELQVQSKNDNIDTVGKESFKDIMGSKDINLFKFVIIYRSQIGAERRLILQIDRVSSSFESRIVLLHKNEEHLVIGENCLVIDLTNIIEHLIRKIADPASEKESKRAYRRYVK